MFDAITYGCLLLGVSQLWNANWALTTPLGMFGILFVAACFIAQGWSIWYYNMHDWHLTIEPETIEYRTRRRRILISATDVASVAPSSWRRGLSVRDAAGTELVFLETSFHKRAQRAALLEALQKCCSTVADSESQTTK